MDIAKIKEDSDRFQGNAVRSFMGRGGAEADARQLAFSVPDLLTEIERLKIDIRRMRDLAAVAREDVGADRVAAAFAALGAM